MEVHQLLDKAKEDNTANVATDVWVVTCVTYVDASVSPVELLGQETNLQSWDRGWPANREAPRTDLHSQICQFPPSSLA
jgi:hypothetical protein